MNVDSILVGALISMLSMSVVFGSVALWQVGHGRVSLLVQEPLTVKLEIGGSNWIIEESSTLQMCVYAGDIVKIKIRADNRANAPIFMKVVFSTPNASDLSVVFVGDASFKEISQGWEVSYTLKEHSDDRYLGELKMCIHANCSLGIIIINVDVFRG